MTIQLLSGLAAVLILTPATAVAQTFDPLPVPRWTSADGETTVKLRGRVYYDLADIDWSSPFGGGASDEDEFRASRLGLEAASGRYKAVAEFNFGEDAVTAADVYAQAAYSFGTIRVGHFKTPNSIEEATSSRYTTFMERGLATDLFGLDRRIGVSWTWAQDGLYASAGLFGGTLADNFEFSESDRSHAAAARLAWSGEIEGTRLHVGGSWRRLDHDGGTRLRVRPQAHLAPRFQAADFRRGAAAGEADASDFYGLELALVRGPFHAQAELSRLELDLPGTSPAVDSAVIQAGWFLTGETRPYKSSSAAFGRVDPAQAVSRGGHGAWEIAARLDTADLTEAGQGEIRTTTLGLNWYAERHVRVMLNWIDAEHDAPGFTESADILQARLQLDF